jgi:hypothetical protein
MYQEQLAFGGSGCLPIFKRKRQNYLKGVNNVLKDFQQWAEWF